MIAIEKKANSKALRKMKTNCVCWNMPAIPASWRQRQENHKFESSPGKGSGTLSQNQNTNKRVGMCARGRVFAY
jgi:hypothetical protein